MRTQERMVSRFITVAAVLVAGYLGAYGVARASHVLVRKAMFYGAADSAVFTRHGRWIHNQVERPDGATSLRWTETAFSPLIAAERTFWNTVGRHFLPPCGA